MNDKVSVIIPYYNTNPEYFAKCMKSVLSQTYTNFEVIIVNDGSDEEYSKLLDKYKSFRNVYVINQENKGVSAARNKGINFANGTWCTFVDSDDWLEKNCLENFVNITNQCDMDYILSKVNIVRNNSIQENINALDLNCLVSKKDLISSILNFGNPVITCADTPWAKFFKLDFLKFNNIYFNEQLKNGEDVVFNFECALNADKVYYLNLPTYNYNFNEFSECRTNSDLENKTTTFIKILREKFKQYNIQDETLLDNYVVRLVNRMLRKYFNSYDNCSEFEKDFEKLLMKPEYSQTFSKKTVLMLNAKNNKLLQMCQNKKFIEIYNLMKSKQITK